MGSFRPKDVFRKAKEAERLGKKREASAQYASLAIFLRRRDNAKDAKALLERAILLSPESPRLYAQLALCELSVGSSEDAQRAMVLFARYTIRRGKVEAYGPYLEEHLIEHPALRQIFYEALLDVDRTTAEPFLKLARCLIEQANWVAAQATLLEALQTKTQIADVISVLREALQAQKRPDMVQHLDQFERGKLNRDDLILLLNEPRRTAPSKTGSEGARSRSARSAPVAGSTGAQCSRSSAPPAAPPETTAAKNLNELIRDLELQMGASFDDGRDSVEPLVREFRQKSSKILGSDAKARMDMALAFFEMGLMEHARDELAQIASTDPRFAESQCFLGEILIAEGSDLGALEVFQRCLRSDSVTPEIYREATYKLIQVYSHLGDHSQALHYANELDRKNSGYRDLKNIKSQLQDRVTNHGEDTQHSQSGRRSGGGRGRG